MLTPEFISAFAELLWPIVTLVAVFLFRGDLRALLKRIKKAKVGNHEIDFSEDASALKNTVANAVAETEKRLGSPKTNKFYTIDKATPRLSHNQPSPDELDRQNDEDLARAQSFILPGQGLLPHPIAGQNIINLRKHISENAFEAVFLIYAELERSIRDVLLAEGVDLRRSKGLRDLAKMLQLKKKLSLEFDQAIHQFSDLRNKLAHTYKKVSTVELTSIANAGLQLIDIIQRIPRNIIYIQQTDIPIYTDNDGRVQAMEYEGLFLLFAAIPGQTGAGMHVITSKKRYYQTGKLVSSEWGEKTRMDLWIRSSEKEGLLKIKSGSEIFAGRDIGELTDN